VPRRRKRPPPRRGGGRGPPPPGPPPPAPAAAERSPRPEGTRPALPAAGPEAPPHPAEDLVCSTCGKPLTKGQYQVSKQAYGRPLCPPHQKEAAQDAAAEHHAARAGAAPPPPDPLKGPDPRRPADQERRKAAATALQEALQDGSITPEWFADQKSAVLDRERPITFLGIDQLLAEIKAQRALRAAEAQDTAAQDAAAGAGE
jgi:hypothetical protein